MSINGQIRIDITENGYREECSIYVLELEDGKYYVGKSENPENPYNRIQIHFKKNGSEWTKFHLPIRVFNVFPN